MEPYRRPNFSSIGSIAQQGPSFGNERSRGYNHDLRRSVAESINSIESGQSGSSGGRFRRTAEKNMGMSSSGYSRRGKKDRNKDDSSSEDDGDENGQMMQMMMLAQMMGSESNEDDNQVKLVKELQKQNEQILKLKQNFGVNGSPYANQMSDRIQQLERMLLDSDKKAKTQNSGYFFNQMLMMMMMNPSILDVIDRLSQQSFDATDAPNDDGWSDCSTGGR